MKRGLKDASASNHTYNRKQQNQFVFIQFYRGIKKRVQENLA